MCYINTQQNETAQCVPLASKCMAAAIPVAVHPYPPLVSRIVMHGTLKRHMERAIKHPSTNKQVQPKESYKAP